MNKKRKEILFHCVRYSQGAKVELGFSLDSQGMLGSVCNVFVDLYPRKQRTLYDEAKTTV